MFQDILAMGAGGGSSDLNMKVFKTTNSGNNDYTIKNDTSNWVIIKGMSNSYTDGPTGLAAYHIRNGTSTQITGWTNMSSSVSGVFGCCYHVGDFELKTGDTLRLASANPSSVNAWAFIDNQEP